MSKALAVVTGLLLLVSCQGACTAERSNNVLARDILAELVAINTAPSGGNDTRAAVASLARRLEDAGFDDGDISVLGQSDKLPNLVVRYRSTTATRDPLLLMAHLDVVDALPEDWTVDPFVMTEKDGYYYGRGTTDNKAGAAMLVANFIRLRQEGFEPDRDLIIMLTADEETTGDAAKWLASEHRPLIDAEFGLNTDGGMVILKDGRPLAFNMQTSEKIFVSYRFEALDPGGHSSRPRADTSISRLARTLVDLQAQPFPIDLNETTRAYFTRWLEFAPPDDRDLIRAIISDRPNAEIMRRIADAPYYNALARTTCVATQLSAGHAENALPQSARAVVNCRVLPQSSAAATQAVLEKLATPNRVTVSQLRPAIPSPPSPLVAKVVEPVTALAQTMWPAIAVIPEMSTGASDGVFVRNAGIPVYGVSAIANDPDDLRAHGKDERIGVQAFRDASEYWYRLVKILSQS